MIQNVHNKAVSKIFIKFRKWKQIMFPFDDFSINIAFINFNNVFLNYFLRWDLKEMINKFFFTNEDSYSFFQLFKMSTSWTHAKPTNHYNINLVVLTLTETPH